MPHPGLDFSVSVPEVAGCHTTGGDASCSIRTGAAFPVRVSLDSFEDIPSYGGFDLIFEFTGLTALPGTANMSAWPDCQIPVSSYESVDEGKVAMACAIGLPPTQPSTYVGVIGETGFACGQSGTVALLHGPGNTDLVEDGGAPIHAESLDGRETLTIECSPCGDIPPALSGPAPPTDLERTATAEPLDLDLQVEAAVTPTGPAPTHTTSPPTETPASETPVPTRACTPTAISTAAAAIALPSAGSDAGPSGSSASSAWAFVLAASVVAGVAGLAVAGWRYARGPRS